MSTMMGVERNDFSPRDGGPEIKGQSIYVSRPIDPDKGAGVAVERLYISDAKASQLGLDLHALVGQEIRVYYNRYGKVDAIVPAE